MWQAQYVLTKQNQYQYWEQFCALPRCWVWDKMKVIIYVSQPYSTDLYEALITILWLDAHFFLWTIDTVCVNHQKKKKARTVVDGNSYFFISVFIGSCHTTRSLAKGWLAIIQLGLISRPLTRFPSLAVWYWKQQLTEGLEMRLPQTCCCELQLSKQCKKNPKPHAVRSLQRCTLCCFTTMGMLNVLRPTAVS